MSERMKPILGAYVASIVVFALGLRMFFMEMSAAGPGDWTGLKDQPIVALAISSIFMVLFFDWLAQSIGAPIKAAMTIAISQILLVDVFYVLNGQRSPAVGLASAALIIVGWYVAGTVYAKLSADS